jgi:signal transduction histidine kinase
MFTDMIDSNKPKNLLLVDDEAEITRTLQRFFRKNYNVFIANDASEAFKLVENRDINVIISDQRMPGMSGVEFLSKVKQYHPDTIRLILTGYSDVEAIIAAINEGAIFRYITKPWNFDELNATVYEAFEKYSLVEKNKQLMAHLEEANNILEKKVEERTRDLKLLNEKLIVLNNEKNKFLGIAAHDLRNPIGTSLAFTDLLLEDYDGISDNEKRQYLKIILERSEFSLRLLNDLLDISKIEAGKIDLELKKQNYRNFIEQVISFNQVLARRKQILLNLDYKAPDIFPDFDKSKIEQAMNNLIKYSKPKTEVWITVELCDEGVHTFVKDQGCGIEEKELEHLFQPFHKAGNVPTGGESSTGLGLAIVKKIIEAHHGKIKVKSEKGVGSCFCFILPFQT